jgi:hypothetical protein
MRALTPAESLKLWERGERLHSVDRALHMLASAFPERSAEELAQLPLGCRNALLLAVRRATWGEWLDAQEQCPACNEQVEFSFSCSVLAAGEPPPSEWQLESGRHRLTLRPLNSLDAAAAARHGDLAGAYAEMLARSVVAAECDGEQVAPGALPADASSAVAASLAAHDSRAELLLDLMCPACNHSWQTCLNIANFIWSELTAHAMRLVEEVHTLAQTYGWAEADILAMSDIRRSAYIALANR